MQAVCVFCGSSPGRDPAYRAAAVELGLELVRRGLRLVYGGGNIGLMGVVADAVMQAGGEVVGVIPQTLVDKEVAHFGLTELIVVGSMHERKARMADLSDAFIALPGGFGTLEEFFEVLTWAQLGLHNKPCAVLNIGGFYNPLLAMLDHAVAERFLRPGHRSLVLTGERPAEVLDVLETSRPIPEEKWIDRESS